jgi:uncharacterized repeat protein (TIGR01451 family)
LRTAESKLRRRRRVILRWAWAASIAVMIGVAALGAATARSDDTVPASTVTASADTLPVNGEVTITVTLRDAAGAVAAERHVTLSSSSQTSNPTPADAVTDGDGVATFTVTDAVAEQVTYTATTDSVTLGQTSVTFTEAPPTDTPPPNVSDNGPAAAAGVDLSIHGTPGSSQVNVNSDLHYTLAVANGGPSTATNVVVIDGIPSGVRFSGASDGCSFVPGNPDVPTGGGAVTCEVGTMESGGSTTLDVEVVPVTANPSLGNSASVGSSEQELAPADNDSAAAPVAVGILVDLKLAKAAPATAQVGDTLTYTLTVSNLGHRDANGVYIEDTLPAGVSFSSSDGACGRSESTIRCGPFDVLFDESDVVLHIAVTVNLSGTLHNTATLRLGQDQIDTNPSDNTASADTVVSGVERPGNDNFANAYELTGLTGSTSGSNVNATTEDFEPTSLIEADTTTGATVWWKWTAPQTGEATINTLGSESTRSQGGELDTTLAVYTRGDGLHEETSNDDDSDHSTSAVAFHAIGGTTYFIQVGGYDRSEPDEGSVALNWSLVAAPANDNIEAAQELTDGAGELSGSNVLATLQDGEPNQVNTTIANSVWFEWSPVASGRARLAVSHTSFNALLAVWRGPGTDSGFVGLTRVVNNSADGCCVAFDATAGTHYYVQLAAAGDPPGPYALSWHEDSISLSPATATNVVGTNHTVTATVVGGDEPVVGAMVTFDIVAGPNEETSGHALTDTNGHAAFTYTSDRTGTDTIHARATVNDFSVTSNSVTKTWTAVPSPPPPSSPPSSPPSPSSGGGGTVAIQPASVGDVHVSISAPSFARVGDLISITATITNKGPGRATGVSFSNAVPPGTSFVSVSQTVGSCGLQTSAVVCSIGALDPGGSGAAVRQPATTAGVSSSTVTMVFRAERAGPVSNSASASSDSDPDSSNNSSSTTISVGTADSPPPEPPAPPPPSQPDQVNGVGQNASVNGTQVPDGQVVTLVTGDLVDVTHGSITITNFSGDVATFSGEEPTFSVRRGPAAPGATTAPSSVVSIFRIGQPSTPNSLTSATLFGGDFTVCGTASSRHAAGMHAPPKKKVVRQLWGKAHGKFQTRSRYSSATVRGTVWLTQDRCDGSLVTVAKDSVDVFDFTLKKTITLIAGQSYLAQPKRKTSTAKPKKQATPKKQAKPKPKPKPKKAPKPATPKR